VTSPDGRSIVIGVDSSTQSTKVEARRMDTGELLAVGRSRHPAARPPASEQDPDQWWRALIDAFGQLGSIRDSAAAVSVAGQQHGLVLLDPSGTPVRPAKLWNDTTSAPQAAALTAAVGGQQWADACGSVPLASFTITKLAWVAANEPEALERCEAIMLPHDYLTWRLTGRAVTDRGDASGTGWFDPSANTYRSDMVELIDTIDPGAAEAIVGLLPVVLAPDEPAGELIGEAAEQLGLPPGVIVGPGTGDNMAAALGLGLLAGDVAMSLGTSGTIYSVSNTATADGTGAVAGFADAKGQFLPLVCTLNATKVTDTVARWLGVDAGGLAELALNAEPNADGPALIPYFDGERTPNLPDARGKFVGLTNDTSREDLALAAHDGVLKGLFAGREALAAASVDLSGRTHLIGGGARNAAYRQRSADLLGHEIYVPDNDETVATGAAVQAAVVALGVGFDEVGDGWGLGAATTTEPRGQSAGAR